MPLRLVILMRFADDLLSRTRLFWVAMMVLLLLVTLALAPARGQVPGAMLLVPEDFPVQHQAFYEALGRDLFFDPALSANGQVSCATCHLPEHNFTDGLPVAIGNFGKLGNRNTPTCRNTGYFIPQFWGGQADGLEAQAQGPLENALEMADRDNDGDADQSIAEVVLRLQERYGPRFKDGVMTERSFRWALAAFQRSLVSGESPYDRWVGGGTIDAPRGPVTAMSKEARRGAKTFARYCQTCHAPPLFTDAVYNPQTGTSLNPDPYHVTGSTSSGDDDQGRQATTGQPGDFKRFKTPSLRDVESTAPYGVGGNFPTLLDRIDFYNEGIGVAVNGQGVESRDAFMPPAGFLAAQDASLSLPPGTSRNDLLEFLKALSTKKKR